MLTTRESWQLEKFVMKYKHYFHTDEDALKVLKARNMQGWSVEGINQRFRKLQAECNAGGNLDPINDWFRYLNAYYIEHMNGPDAGKAAQAYINHVRALRMWMTHFDHWYEQFQKELEHDHENSCEAAAADESQFPF